MQVRPWRSGVAIALGVLVLGLCIAAAGGISLQREADAQARAAFERGVERVHNEVAQRFHAPTEALNGIKGLYAARQRVSRAEFRAFVASFDLARDFPGVRGFGFVQRVMRDDLQRFLAGNARIF